MKADMSSAATSEAPPSVEATDPPGLIKVSEFRSELEKLINRYSMENGSNTPDFILAQYLTTCLGAFNVAIASREQWFGRPTQDEVKSG